MEEALPQNRMPLRRPVRAIPQAQEQKKERIKMWMTACMVIVALCVDLTQTILTLFGIGLVVGPIIGAVAYFAFWVWFMLLGVSFTKNLKKLGVMGLSALIEMSFSFLPGFTAGVAATIFMTMAEDKDGLLGKAASMAQGKIKP